MSNNSENLDGDLAAEMPPLLEAWDCNKVERRTAADGSSVWNYRQPGCNKEFKGLNSTKVLAHWMGTPGKIIAKCKGTIDPLDHWHYKQLHNSKEVTKIDKVKKDTQMAMEIQDTQAEVVTSLTGQPPDYSTPNSIVLPTRRRKSPTDGMPIISLLGNGPVGFASATSASTITMTPPLLAAKKPRIFGQHKIFSGAPNPQAEKAMDVAIADLIHSRGDSFSLSNCPKFVRVLNCAKMIPSTYKPPGRNEIGGQYLDELYENTMVKTKTALRTDSELCGLSVFGDGATMKNSPLVNVLGAGVNCPSGVLDIIDCTGHCEKGA